MNQDYAKKELHHYLRDSDTNPFLRIGPTAPDTLPGWKYHDFFPMPNSLWNKLIELLGQDDIVIISSNSKHLPPNATCRAAMWISPTAQDIWKDYIQKHNN